MIIMEINIANTATAVFVPGDFLLFDCSTVIAYLVLIKESVGDGVGGDVDEIDGDAVSSDVDDSATSCDRDSIVGFLVGCSVLEVVVALVGIIVGVSVGEPVGVVDSDVGNAVGPNDDDSTTSCDRDSTAGYLVG